MVRVIDYSLNDHLIVEKTLIRLSNSRCHAMLSHDALWYIPDLSSVMLLEI
jgi:hypothetical protein